MKQCVNALNGAHAAQMQAGNYEIVNDNGAFLGLTDYDDLIVHTGFSTKARLRLSEEQLLKMRSLMAEVEARYIADYGCP